MKKFLSFVLAAMMLFAIIPFSAMAADSTVSQLESEVQALVGTENSDAKFRVLVTAPAQVTVGEAFDVVVTVDSIVEGSAIDLISAVMDRSESIALQNELSSNAVDSCLATVEGKTDEWEDFTRVDADDASKISVEACTVGEDGTVQTLTENNVLSFNFSFVADGTETEVALWIPHATVSSMSATDFSTACGNGSYVIIEVVEKAAEEVKNGIVAEEDGTLAYYIDGVKQYGSGLIYLDGYYYHVNSSGVVAVGEYWVSNDNGYGYTGVQQFGEDGKMIIKDGIVAEDDGTLAYYINNVKQYDKGLIRLADGYYYVNSSGVVATGDYWITKNNGYGYYGVYTFDEAGRLIIKNGVYELSDGTLAFYYYNVRQYDLGLIYYEGDYYYVNNEGIVMTGEYWVTKDNYYPYYGLQQFTEDGKLIISDSSADDSVSESIVEDTNANSEIVTESDGTLAYYVDGVKQYGSGLVCVGGYYYHVNSSGVVAVGEYWVSNDNGYGYTGVQQFGEDGKMIIKDGIVAEDDGTLAYYINNVKQYDKGLIRLADGYYYVNSSGVVATGDYWITKNNGYGYYGVYTFDETGKLLIKNGVYEQADGTLNFYFYNVKQYDLGLIYYEGDYYYVNNEGNVMTGEYWVTKDNYYPYYGLQQFTEDGKLITE